MPLIDHVNLPVGDLVRSRWFYENVLATLGQRLLLVDGDAVGFGTDAWAFGIVRVPPPITPLHVAFVAPSRDAVDRFFEAATALGAPSLGAPGLRPHYAAHYYAAFVRDPDGHSVEAVCRAPALP